MFSQSLVLAPAQAYDSASAEQGFPDPTSQPSSEMPPPRPRQDIATLATQVKSCPSGQPFSFSLPLPTPTAPGGSSPPEGVSILTAAAPPPTPSLLALECGIESLRLCGLSFDLALPARLVPDPALPPARGIFPHPPLIKPQAFQNKSWALLWRPRSLSPTFY